MTTLRLTRALGIGLRGVLLAALLGAAAAAPDEKGGDTIRVRGRVLGPDGKPVAGAAVSLSPMRREDERSKRAPVAKTATDARGAYELSVRKADLIGHASGPDLPGGDIWTGAHVVASAPGLGLGWSAWNRTDKKGEVTLRLPPDDVPIEGRVVNLEGQPVGGIRVDVVGIGPIESRLVEEAYHRNPDEAGGLMLSMPFGAAGIDRPVVTGADGRFKLAGAGRDRKVEMRVSGPSIGHARLEAATRDMPPQVRLVPQPRGTTDKFVTYGARFDYPAVPGRSVRGTVRDEASGKPMAGVAVMSLHFAGPFQGFDPRGASRAVTDPQGRYELHGFPKGAGNQIIAVPSDDQPYFMRAAELPDEPGLAPLTADLPLHKGVWLTGKVTDKATGRPVSARLLYTTYIDNPHTRALPEFRRQGNSASLDGFEGCYRSGADGTFKLVAAPGKAIVAASCDAKGYRKGAGFDAVPIFKKEDAVLHMYQPAPRANVHEAVREIDIAPGAASATCDLQVDPGETVHVAVTGPDGKPARGKLRVRGQQAENFGGPADEPLVAATFPAKGFSAGELRTIYVLDDENHLGRAVHAKLDDLPGRKLEVRLQPMARVTGRLLTKNGDPLGATELEAAEQGGTGRTVRLVKTDAEGRFSTTLPAGTKYTLSVSGGPYVATPVANDIAPEPGGAIDLGRVKIEPAFKMRR